MRAILMLKIRSHEKIQFLYPTDLIRGKRVGKWLFHVIFMKFFRFLSTLSTTISYIFSFRFNKVKKWRRNREK